MNYDKIKNTLDAVVFEFWSNCNDRDIIQNAYYLLKKEIEEGLIPNSYKYHAELQLLQLKLGV